MAGKISDKDAKLLKFALRTKLGVVGKAKATKAKTKMKPVEDDADDAGGTGKKPERFGYAASVSPSRK